MTPPSAFHRLHTGGASRSALQMASLGERGRVHSWFGLNDARLCPPSQEPEVHVHHVSSEVPEADGRMGPQVQPCTGRSQAPGRGNCCPAADALLASGLLCDLRCVQK